MTSQSLSIICLDIESSKTDLLLKDKLPEAPPCLIYRGADKSLARPTSRCILFDGENISFDGRRVIYIYIYIYI
jgi:hypothetical protein